jgi:hypothetical protein
VTAWNVATRTARWRTTVSTAGYAADLRALGARVVVATSKGSVFALDLDTGAALWQAPLSDPGLMLIIRSGDHHVLTGSEDPVRIDLATGAVHERIALPEKSYVAPIAGDARCLLQTADGVCKVDPQELAHTELIPVGASHNLSVAHGGAHVALPPMSEAHIGTVLTLQRTPVPEASLDTPRLAERVIVLAPQSAGATPASVPQKKRTSNKRAQPRRP